MYTCVTDIMPEIDLENFKEIHENTVASTSTREMRGGNRNWAPLFGFLFQKLYEGELWL